VLHALQLIVAPLAKISLFSNQENALILAVMVIIPKLKFAQSVTLLVLPALAQPLINVVHAWMDSY